MMEIFQKNKKIFLFVGIFLFVVIIYFIFSSGSGNAPKKVAAPGPTTSGLISEVMVSQADEAGGRELLAMLTELQSISLDSSIFSSSVFGSLNDLSKPIEPQPLGSTLGRRNPFSDFSGTAVVSTGTGAASTLPAGATGDGSN